MPELSPDATSIQQNIKDTAMAQTAVKNIETEYGAKELLAQQELNKLTEDLNSLKKEGEELDNNVLEKLNTQKKVLENIKTEQTKITDVIKKAQALSITTGKNFKDTLKAEQESLKIQMKKNDALKISNDLLNKQIKVIQEATKEQIKQTQAAGKALSDKTRSATGGAFSKAQSIEGAMGLAADVMTAGITKGMTKAFGAKAGGVAGGAAGGLADMIIQMITFNLQYGMRSRQTELLLDTTRGGAKGNSPFSVLGSNYMASEEYASAAGTYAKAGFRGNQLQNRGTGKFTGIEAFGGLEKVTGNPAAVQQLGEVFAAITEGSVNSSIEKMGALWLNVQSSVKDTGIAAQKVYQWTAQLAEQAQYLNVDYKLVSYQMNEMVKNQKQMATIGINVAKDGGKIMGDIANLSRTMPIEIIAGLAQMRTPGGSPFQNIASRQYGKNYAENVGFEGKGENFIMTAKNQGGLEGSALIEQQKDIKNAFSEMTKGMDLQTKEGKAQALSLIPKMSESLSIDKDVAKTILMSKNYEQMTLEEQKNFEKALKDPQTKMVDSLSAIEKGLTHGMLYVKLEETLKSSVFGLLGGMLSILINLPNSIANAMEKITGGNKRTEAYDAKIKDVYDGIIKSANGIAGMAKAMGSSSGIQIIDRNATKEHVGSMGQKVNSAVAKFGESFSPGEYRINSPTPFTVDTNKGIQNSMANNNSNTTRTYNFNIMSGGILTENGLVDALKGIINRGVV